MILDISKMKKKFKCLVVGNPTFDVEGLKDGGL